MSSETEHTTKRENGVWALLMNRLALPMLTFSLGFGGSQMLAMQTLRDRVLVQESIVSKLDRDISRVDQAAIDRDVEIKKQVSESRLQTDERIKNVVVLMEGIMKQNTEVIGLFRLQQQVK